MVLWRWPDDEENFMSQQANKVLEWADHQMTKGTFPREDYRELLELIVIYLGGSIKRKTEAGVEEPIFYMISR